MRPHIIIGATIQAILGMDILTNRPDSKITDLAALDGLDPLERLGILEEILSTEPSIAEHDIDATLKSLIPFLGELHYFGVLMILNLFLEKGCPITPNLINFSTKYPDLRHPNLLKAKANFNQSRVLTNLQRIPAPRRVIILPHLRNLTTTPVISTMQVNLPNISAFWFDDVLALSWDNPKEAYRRAFVCLRNGANPNSPCANGVLPLDCVLNSIAIKLMRKLFALMLCTFDGRFNSELHDHEIIREIYPLQRKVQVLRYFFIYFGPIFSVLYGLESVRDSIFDSALHFILKQD